MNDGGSQSGQEFSLTASKGVESRTHLGDPYEDENGKKILPMYWTEGDRIFVSSKDGSVTGTLELTSEPGQPTGTFTGYVFGDPSDLYYSIYPVPDGGKVDLSTLSGREIRTPMVGTISDNKNVAFDNTCGMMVVENLDQEGFDATASFKLYAGTTENDLISLAATAEIEKDENGVVKVDSEGKVSLKYTSSDVEYINLTDAEFIEGKLYIPYDLQNNNDKEGIHLFIKSDDSQNLESITNSPVSLKEATIGKPLYADAKVSVGNNGSVSKVYDKEIGAEENTSGNATVEVATTENAINIPSVPAEVTNVTIEMPIQLSGNKKEAVVAIEEIVSSEAVITITSSTETEQASQIEDMTVILPSGTTQEQVAQQVNINMPNTTVTVKSADGNILMINDMLVSTADNTLIVGADVEIKSLTIKKGNVQVFGKVGEIKRDGQNKDDETVVTIEKGGEVGKVQEGGNIRVIDNSNTSVAPKPTIVSDLTGLQTAIKNGATNIILTRTIILTDDTDIILNNKTLTLSEDFVWENNAAIYSNGHALTINGTILGCQKEMTGKNYLIKVESDGSKNLNLTNTELRANGVYGAVCVVDTKLGVNNSGIFATNAIAVNIRKKDIQINLGTVVAVDIKGDVNVTNDYNVNKSCLKVGHESTIDGNLNVFGSNSNGLIVEIDPDVVIAENCSGWPTSSTGGDTGSEEEGEPVATLTELTEALENPDVQKILLRAPLTIEVSETMSLNLNGKVITVDKGVWEQADAAITVKPKDTADGGLTNSYKSFNISIYSGETCKIEGEAEDNSKYLIKSTGVNVNLNSTCLQATENLNAIYVENANLDISENSNITSDKGYALNIKALINRAEVFLHNNSTINGAVHFNINYDTNEEGYYSFSGINASQGCAVDGKLTVDGEKSSAFELITKASEGSNTTPKINDIFNGEGWSDAYIVILQRRFSMGGVGADNEEIVLENGETIEFRVSDKTITQMGFRIGKISGDGTIKFVNGTDQTISLSIDIFDLGDNINLEFENGDKFKKELHIYSNRVKELFGLASGGDHVRVYLKQDLTINEGFVCGTNMSRIPEDGVWGCLDIELAGHTLTINSPIQVKGGAFGIVGYEGGGTISSGIEFIKAGAAVSGKETIQLQITPDVTVKCTNITWFGVEGTDADWTQNKTVSFDFMAPEGSSKNDKVRIGRGYELVKVENGEVISGNVHL